MLTFPGLGAALFLLAAALAGQAGVAGLLHSMVPADTDNVLVAAVANLVALSAVVGFGYFRSGEPPQWPRVSRSPVFWAGLGFTTMGGTIVLAELANLTSALLPLPPTLAQLFNQLSSGDLVVALFTVALVAPLTEEFLFRGLLLRGFARRWGAGPGLFLSSALFALFHLNPWQAPTAFLAGLFLGWLVLKTGSLWYPLVVHALFNALPVVLSALGWHVTGYNTLLTPGVVDFQPPLWTLGGAMVLVLGLALTRGWAPLSPAPVSDRVGP